MILVASKAVLRATQGQPYGFGEMSLDFATNMLAGWFVGKVVVPFVVRGIEYVWSGVLGKYFASDLLSIFSRNSNIVHILSGEINGAGKAVGFHHLPSAGSGTGIIAISRNGTNGVYEASVQVNNIAKLSNAGKSTFFPNNWSQTEVIQAINEAYLNRGGLIPNAVGGNTFIGNSRGITIQFYLDSNNKIISAFPASEIKDSTGTIIATYNGF